MTKFKTLLLSIALFITAIASATAQGVNPVGYKPYPHVFVGVQGGVQTTFTNYKQSELITPIAGVQVGAMFTPVVGTRLHVSGIWNRSGVTGIGTYDYKYVAPNLDVMLNLANLFYPTNAPHRFNPYLIGGVGLAYAWDNSDFNNNAAFGSANPLGWTDSRLVHSFRVGAMFEYNVTKCLGINLEVDANNYHDRYNSKITGNGDWQLTAMLGLTFKFGYKKAKYEAPVIETVTQDYVEDTNTETVVAKTEVAPEPEPEPVVETKPAPVVAPARTDVNIYFALNKSEITSTEEAKIKEFANWLKAHPKAKVQLAGYADVDTGNSTINKRLGGERVSKVREMLVKTYGIEASRISTENKGDTVQPYNTPERNRVVIGVAAE